jgi:hypothetical protein
VREENIMGDPKDPPVEETPPVETPEQEPEPEDDSPAS